MKKVMLAGLMVMLVFGVVWYAYAAGTATGTWKDPITRVDGSAFNSATDAAKHTVYWGTVSGTYPNKADVGATATTYTITSLPTGTTYSVVTITDKNGLESAYSNEASKYIAPVQPGGCSSYTLN